MISYRNLEFDSSSLWVVCILGSLCNASSHFNDLNLNDSRVNILIICLTEDDVDPYDIVTLKKLVE